MGRRLTEAQNNGSGPEDENSEEEWDSKKQGFSIIVYTVKKYFHKMIPLVFIIQFIQVVLPYMNSGPVWYQTLLDQYLIPCEQGYIWNFFLL